MHNLMTGTRRMIPAMALIALVTLAGCGKKEFPQPDTSEPLRIENLSANQEVSIFHLTFTIVGGYGPVGYQIDRATEDSVCQCLTPWQRFFEQEPIPGRKGVEQSRNVQLSTKRDFAYRIRAVDSAGNLTPWSQTFRGRSTDPDR